MHCASILTVSPPFHLPSFFPRRSVQAFGCIPGFAKPNFRDLSDYSSKIFRNVYAKLYRNLETGYVSDFEDGIETISPVLYSFMRFLVRYDMYETIDRSYTIVRTRDHRDHATGQ